MYYMHAHAIFMHSNLFRELGKQKSSLLFGAWSYFLVFQYSVSVLTPAQHKYQRNVDGNR